ncbi:MAG: RadC family protein [Shewanella sp.]
MNNRKFFAGEAAGTYVVPEQVTETDILAMALKLAHDRFSKGRKIEQPSSVFSYLQTLMHKYEYEVFGAIFLDTKLRVIRFEALFKGTLDAVSVYPRVVTKRALELNAAAVILVHNHPSGDPEPSEADKRMTPRLRDALSLVDIHTLDHVVVASEGCVSLAERGYLE